MRNYSLVRKKIKKIYLRVKGDCVYVTAPFHVSKEEIDRFVCHHENWINKQIESYHRTQIIQSIQILSKTYAIQWIEEGATHIEGDTIFILNKEEDFQSFCIEYTRRYVVNRFYEICRSLRISNVQLKLGFYKSKWGSCNPTKRLITLNMHLIFTSKECLDAVIYHELAHLYVTNHSKQFYDVLLAWCPSYKEIHNECNQYKPLVFL